MAPDLRPQKSCSNRLRHNSTLKFRAVYKSACYKLNHSTPKRKKKNSLTAHVLRYIYDTVSLRFLRIGFITATVNLSLCVINQASSHDRRGMKVLLHAFLNLAVDGGEGRVTFTPPVISLAVTMYKASTRRIYPSHCAWRGADIPVYLPGIEPSFFGRLFAIVRISGGGLYFLWGRMSLEGHILYSPALDISRQVKHWIILQWICV
jgi:hypothetical protein